MLSETRLLGLTSNGESPLRGPVRTESALVRIRSVAALCSEPYRRPTRLHRRARRRQVNAAGRCKSGAVWSVSRQSRSALSLLGFSPAVIQAQKITEVGSLKRREGYNYQSRWKSPAAPRQACVDCGGPTRGTARLFFKTSVPKSALPGGGPSPEYRNGPGAPCGIRRRDRRTEEKMGMVQWCTNHRDLAPPCSVRGASSARARRSIADAGAGSGTGSRTEFGGLFPIRRYRVQHVPRLQYN